MPVYVATRLDDGLSRGPYKTLTFGTGTQVTETTTDVTLAITPGGGADPFLAKLRLAGDITNATTTLTALTGMVFTYEANSFYVFEMFMACTSAAATTGYGFAVDVSSAVTTVGLTFSHQLATGGTRTGGDSIADNVSRGLSTGVPAITVVNPVMGHGFLMTGANTGTAQFMFRPEVAASATCKAGSVIRVMKIV